MGANMLTDLTDIYFLTSSTEGGFTMYFYLRIHKGKKHHFFKRLRQEEELNLTEYGDILESGAGKTPSQESVDKMKRDYRFTTPREALIQV